MSNESADSARQSTKPLGRCPICNRPAAEQLRPFCSPRCRDVDLHRWLSGSYIIPGAEGDEEDRE
jgi:uncharacterized protein